MAYSIVGLDEGVVDGDDVDIVVLDTAWEGQSRRGWAGMVDTYALRKTILPMRPKPLIPTLTTMVML